MCGFIGFLDGQKNKEEEFTLGLKEIEARGITSYVLKQEDGKYGYCRLPTDDINNASLSELGSIENSVLLFNGLITNVDYLADKFELSEDARRSDRICLHEGLIKNGANFLKSCRGMFAIAFINQYGVTLARDTIGIKPLYYSEGFAFSSEIKGLRHLKTNVFEVLPGEIVHYNKKTSEITKEIFQFEAYENFTKADLKKSLEQSIVSPTKRYLEQSPHKKIAILLSGGLDSSIVGQFLANALRKDQLKRVVAFCIGEDDAPDISNATKLAKHLGVKLIRVSPYSAEESLEKLQDITFQVESPLSRVVKVALLYDALAKAIKKNNIDIVIGGEGADELFFGYHRFIDKLKYHQSSELFKLFFEGVFYYSLLQRFERIFARHQIEGRVPYLDQEVAELSRRYAASEKIIHSELGHESKLPLRLLGKEIGLPAYIYNREKEKMTAGATNKENSSSEIGYLEQEAKNIKNMTFAELVRDSYSQYFFHQSDDLLQRPSALMTEERLMSMVAQYIQANVNIEEEVEQSISH